MPPRACKTCSNLISAPKEPSRCNEETYFPISFSDKNNVKKVNYFVLDFSFSRLVGGAGDIKLTKDGNTLLKEMVKSLSLSFLGAKLLDLWILLPLCTIGFSFAFCSALNRDRKGNELSS